MKENLEHGRRARDFGMDQVSEHTTDEWRSAYQKIIEERFAQFPIGKAFIGESLRSAAKRAGLAEPHHCNAWSANAGAFIRRWLKDGRIVVEGMSQAKDVNAHARYTRRYRKVK